MCFSFTEFLPWVQQVTELYCAVLHISLPFSIAQTSITFPFLLFTSFLSIFFLTPGSSLFSKVLLPSMWLLVCHVADLSASLTRTEWFGFFFFFPSLFYTPSLGNCHDLHIACPGVSFQLE